VNPHPADPSRRKRSARAWIQGQHVGAVHDGGQAGRVVREIAGGRIECDLVPERRNSPPHQAEAASSLIMGDQRDLAPRGPRVVLGQREGVLEIGEFLGGDDDGRGLAMVGDRRPPAC